jgi:hypothetical protein
MLSSIYSSVVPLLRTINTATESNKVINTISHFVGADLLKVGPYGAAIIVLGGLLKKIYDKKIEPWVEERKEVQEYRKKLFPSLKKNTEFFVGPRDPKTLTPSDEDIETAARTGILGFYAKCTLKENVKTYGTNDLGQVIFERHLCGIGGPVPNPYTGLVLYKQPYWKLPFEYGPKIRKFYEKNDIVGLKQLKEDWYISKRKEDKPQFKPSPITLDDETKRYEVDYGFIIKAPTIDPYTMKIGAHDGYLFSGCHWEGGRGAVEALKRKDVLKGIYDIVEEENKKRPPEERRSLESTFFQAIIRCEYDHKHNKVEKVNFETAGIIKT